MKKTINLKVGDPVTCMRRYYAGNPYHGQIQRISDMYINVGFDDGAFNYLRHGGYLSGEPCSLTPGHIEPEPLTLPETVEFEKGDRVLAWGFSYAPNHSIKMPGIYIRPTEGGHYVKSSSGNLCKFFHVEPFTEAALYAQFPEEAPEQPTQPEQSAPVEPDETPKEGDWCAFWDKREDFTVRKYGKILAERDCPHYDEFTMCWEHARKLKPSDLSPELWAIIKNEDTQ